MNQCSRLTEPKRNTSRLIGVTVVLLVAMVTSITHSQASDPLASTDSVEQDLKDIAQLESNFEQELALMKLFDVATNTVLYDVLEQSERIESTKFRTTVRSVAVRKLTTVDPKDTLERISGWDAAVRAPLITVAYQEWSVLDLEAAISYMRKLDESNLQAAMRGILDSRADLGSKRIEEIASQFGIEGVANAWLADSMGRNPIEDPEKAWDELVRTFPDNLFEIKGDQLDLVAHVLNASWEKDGIKALRRLDRSLRDRPGRIRLMQAFLEHLADEDPELALDVAIDLNRNEDDLIASVRMLIWADDDPFCRLTRFTEDSEQELTRRPCEGFQPCICAEWNSSFDHRRVGRLPVYRNSSCARSHNA